MVRLLSVNVFALPTNDSFSYIWRSQALVDGGFVEQGYRQIGYPLWIRLVDELRPLFGWDRLFALAMMQRVILVIAGLWIWYRLRFWSLPMLILFVTTGTAVALTNFLLTEGLSLPLCLLFSALLVELVVSRSANPAGIQRALVVGAGFVVVALALLKLQFAVLWFVYVAAAWLRANRSLFSRSSFAIALGFPILLIGMLAMAQSFENRTELGVFEPVSERARADWYGAWMSVFDVDAADTTVPEIAEYYDDGDLYAFLHPLEDREPDYLVRRQIIEERIESMFDAAGTSKWRTRILAFWGALQLGRIDDLSHLVDKALTIDGATLDAALENNSLARQEGSAGVLAQLNEGEESAVLTSSELLPSVSRFVPDYRPFRAVLATTALLIATIGIVFSRKLRWFAGTSLLAVVAVAAALGLSYIDNLRYLIPGAVVSLTVATLLARDLSLTYVVGDASRKPVNAASGDERGTSRPTQSDCGS